MNSKKISIINTGLDLGKSNQIKSKKENKQKLRISNYCKKSVKLSQKARIDNGFNSNLFI